MGGALDGIRIVEFLGIGPGPFAGMMLADHGAEVIRVVRPGPSRDLSLFERHDVLGRSRTVIQVDMKAPEGRAVVRDLCRTADGVIEGYRPGVMERLGLGPDVLLADTPRLVYGRVTGWGQDGPLAQAAGHDINYIALNGVLHSVGREGCKPVPPLNYVGDFGGGGMLLAFGMAAALLAVARGGTGQVIDAAMVDGSSLLAGMVWQMKAAKLWVEETGGNTLSGAAPFYDSYACADGRHIAIGSIEPAFYLLLRQALGIADDPLFDAQMDRATWAEASGRIAALFATRTRAEWCAIMEGTDICFAPVLSFDEALDHPHMRARSAFLEVDGCIQPTPAPRFSATPAAAPRGVEAGHGNAAVLLTGLGYAPDRVAVLEADGVIA
ncbi:MAG TPA: CaiB/BaiF CoA-transferase family protein [Sphingobium sp.]